MSRDMFPSSLEEVLRSKEIKKEGRQKRKQLRGELEQLDKKANAIH
jgi:hypothetical protein